MKELKQLSKRLVVMGGADWHDPPLRWCGRFVHTLSTGVLCPSQSTAGIFDLLLVGDWEI